MCFFAATDRIQPRWLNRWVKGEICKEGMNYLYELAAELLPDGVGDTQLRIIAGNNRDNIPACRLRIFLENGIHGK